MNSDDEERSEREYSPVVLWARALNPTPVVTITPNLNVAEVLNLHHDDALHFELLCAMTIGP